MTGILVVQQYFYPDVSAVSQLLGDLLKAAAETEIKGEYPDITVLCGNTVRNIESVYDENGKLPLKLGRVNIIRLKTRAIFKSMHRIFDFTAFYWGVFWYILFNRKKYEIVISMTSPPLIGFVVALALGRTGKKFIYYIEDLFPELLFDMGYLKHYWIISKLRKFNKYILKKADKVVLLGTYMLRKLKLNYSLADDKAVIISNWTTGIQYKPPVDNNSDVFNIFYTGNLGLSHDFTMLPKFLEAVKAADLNIKFCFNGAGRYYSDVNSVLKDSGVSHVFEGYKNREDHAEYLAGADMFLIAQKNETVGDIFPSKFYSYAAAGRPMLLLGTEKSEIGNFITENEAGIILEIEEDIPEVIAYIKRLMENRAEMELTCKRIADIYTKEMSFCESLNKFTKLIGEVVE